METQFRKVLCSERLPDRHIRHRKISITVPVFDIKDEFLGGDAYNFEFGHWIENQPEFRRGGIVNYWLEEIEAQSTEPVSEEAMMTKAKEFLNGDTPDIQKGVNTMHWAAYRMAKFALYMQQRQVIDKCDCPICGSDDTFSFQQGCHKCRSCDYRFTK